MDLEDLDIHLDPVTGEPQVRSLSENTPTDDPDDVYWDNSISQSVAGVDGSAFAATVYEGNLVVGGRFQVAGGVVANYIASWDGSSWSVLGSGMNNEILSLIVYDGKLIAAGYFTTAGGVAANYIASWDGSVWSAFGSGTDFNVSALTVYDGTLIACGDFTVVGDTVNLTNRLEEAAPVGGVLISHDTYRQVRGVFKVLEQEPLQVTDQARPLPTYLVQYAKPRAFRMLTRGVAGVETRMVGRDAELLMLQNMFQDATEDAEVHVVTIAGDAGVGKSRLLYEFEKWIELLPEEIWYFKGRATPETEDMPYGLLRRMFAHRFDILESDSAAEVRKKFRAGMVSTLEPDQADLVGELLGLDFSASESVQARLGSESFGQLAIAHLVDYLRAIASEPTVIFLEDIHWADDSSLDVFDHLVAALPE